MPYDLPPPADPTVIELRQYTLHPRRRDDLIGRADVHPRERLREQDHADAQPDEEDRRIGHLVAEPFDRVQEPLHQRAA